MDPFATLAELVARCDWTFDDDETRAAPGYLDEASDLARMYGRENWTAANSPRMLKGLVISAVRRFMRNPDGYVQSRAGDEALQWSDLHENAATIYFTTSEIKLIRGLAGTNSLRTAQVTAWGNRRQGPRVGNVSVAGYEGEKAFPYFADPESPW